MAAVNANNEEVVKLLLSAGANVQTKSHGLNTLLSVAKERKNHKIIQLLKEAGAKN